MRDYDKVIMDTEKHMKAVSALTYASKRDKMIDEYNAAIEGLNELSDIIEGLMDEVSALEIELKLKQDDYDNEISRLGRLVKSQDDDIGQLCDENIRLTDLVDLKDETIDFLNHAIRDYEDNYPEFSYYRHDHPEFDWIGNSDDGK